MVREVMQNAALIFWPVFSLILFSAVCFVLVLWTFRSGSGELYHRLGGMALEEGDARTRTPGAGA
jgi:hypothetical protein